MGQNNTKDANGNIILSIKGNINDYATKDMNKPIEVYKAEYDKIYSPIQNLNLLNDLKNDVKNRVQESSTNFSNFNSESTVLANELDGTINSSQNSYNKLNTDFENFKINDYAPFRSSVSNNNENIKTFFNI